jgi:hypothetical protein
MIWLLLAAFAQDASTIDAAVDSLTAQSPSLIEAAQAIQPRATRAGFLRFHDEQLANPRLAPWLLQRLQAESSPDLRYAWADAVVRALPEGDGDWDEAWLRLATEHEDPAVRQVLVSGLRQARPEIAKRGVAAAAADTDPVVRETASAVSRWIR